MPIRIAIMLCVTLAASLADTANAQDASLPNILVIVSDDQGWNDVGYHNEEIRTPNIDELVRTGVELNCHYVMPQCTPTRVALMTGRYPSRFGLAACVANNERVYPIGTLTMASLLKSRGYATGMSGKWHMGSYVDHGPGQFGFDHSHGSLTGAVGMYDHRYRIDSPFGRTWHRNHEFIEEVGHVTDLTAKEVVTWINEKKDGGPWFFYVPFHAVHTPLVEGDPRWTQMNNHIEDVERRLYAAAVSHMDDAVGRIVKALDQTGQRKNTVIIFTSDNGAQVNHGGNAYPPPDPKLTNFSSNEPLRGKKTEVYEGGMRVPAFINWPGTLKPDKVDAPLHVVDWMPTLAGLVGYEADDSPGWDGRDIWPIITGKQSDPPIRTLYWVWGARRNREALRHGDWKILRNGGKVWEMFNLAEDPLEKSDLRESRPRKFDELFAMYEAERAGDKE